MPLYAEWEHRTVTVSIIGGILELRSHSVLLCREPKLAMIITNMSDYLLQLFWQNNAKALWSDSKTYFAVSCRRVTELRIWPPPTGLAQSWGKQQSDSWSSMAPCLTPSTMCSPGQPAALHTLKTCMPS